MHNFIFNLKHYQIMHMQVCSAFFVEDASVIIWLKLGSLS